MNQKQITQRINDILADERLGYKTATVFNNAPLALIQLKMETELHTLQKVLGIEPLDIKMWRNEK